jgi:hypothetical protein
MLKVPITANTTQIHFMQTLREKKTNTNMRFSIYTYSTVRKCWSKNGDTNMMQGGRISRQ